MYLRVFLIAALALVPLPLHASISFTNQAAAAGVASPGRSDGGALGDYDGDGWPDLLVVPLDADAPTMLYHNQGDGRFVDQSQALASVGQAASGAFRLISAMLTGSPEVSDSLVNYGRLEPFLGPRRPKEAFWTIFASW